MHNSSVAPGNTVDSKITISPRFKILPSDLQTFFSGFNSGSLFSSIPVGIQTKNTLHSVKSEYVEVNKLRCNAIFMLC